MNPTTKSGSERSIDAASTVDATSAMATKFQKVTLAPPRRLASRPRRSRDKPQGQVPAMRACRAGTVFPSAPAPGDPDLITVRGRRLVETAEVIVYDRLGTNRLLGLAPPGCTLVDAGKAPRRHGMTQDEITAVLIAFARSGRDVVRLKGGDPFVFGRGGEEAQALAEAGVPHEVVPGVSSAIAAPAAAGIPVTHRGLARTVTVASGHDDPEEPAAAERWRALAGVPGTWCS